MNRLAALEATIEVLSAAPCAQPRARRHVVQAITQLVTSARAPEVAIKSFGQRNSAP
jgi:hypothetical protein